MCHISGSVLLFAEAFLLSIFIRTQPRLSVWPKRNTSPRFYLQLWFSRVAHTSWAGGVWRGPTWEANRWWDEKKKSKADGVQCLQWVQDGTAPTLLIWAGLHHCLDGEALLLRLWPQPAGDLWPPSLFSPPSCPSFLTLTFFLFQLCAFPLAPPPPEHTLNSRRYNLFCERHLNHEADDDKHLYLCHRRQMFSTHSSLMSRVASSL